MDTVVTARGPIGTEIQPADFEAISPAGCFSLSITDSPVLRNLFVDSKFVAQLMPGFHSTNIGFHQGTAHKYDPINFYVLNFDDPKVESMLLEAGNSREKITPAKAAQAALKARYPSGTTAFQAVGMNVLGFLVAHNQIDGQTAVEVAGTQLNIAANSASAPLEKATKAHQVAQVGG